MKLQLEVLVFEGTEADEVRILAKRDGKDLGVCLRKTVLRDPYVEERWGRYDGVRGVIQAGLTAMVREAV